MRKAPAAAVATLALLLAAGCGAGGASTSAPKPSAPAPAPAQAKPQPAAPAAAPSSSATPLAHVVIGKAVNVISFDIADIAQKEGFFRQQGVNAKLEVIRGGSSEANAALVSGGTQFTMANSFALEIARSKKLPLVAVESLDYGVPEQLIVANSWLKSHHLSPSQPLPTLLKGLEGSTFGQIGPTDRAFFELMVRRAGLSPSAFKYVRLGSFAAAAAALEHGLIDELQGSPPTSLQVADQGYGTVLLNYKSVSEFRDMTYDLVMTTQSYAQSHAATVRAVATALAEANDFVNTRPQQAQSILQGLWPELSPSLIKRSLALDTFSPHGLQTATQWKNALTVIKALGVVKGAMQARQGVEWTNQYIDQAKLGG